MPNKSMDSKKTITVIGAGLVGSLLTIFLARKGFKVQLYERRADPRVKLKLGIVGEGRSINLAISTRGLNALTQVGLKEKVLKQAIPMTGRMMHSPDGQLTYQAYGQNENECINSISRGWLNGFLLDEAEKMPGVEIYFDRRLNTVDLEQKSFTVVENDTQKERKLFYEILLGTDGSASAVRHSMDKKLNLSGSEEELSHGYKEFVMPEKAAGQFKMEKNALHIWPRGAFMMIALPNFDGSYTCTLFLPHKPGFGVESFETLTERSAVEQFFKTHFSDFCEFVPDYVDQYFSHPTGRMVTLKCDPWYYKAQALLLGDAAHAIVPFFGQGMNAGFEDVVAFDRLLESSTSWEQMFAAFFEKRKGNSDAIADMAVENFTEMSSKTADPKFLYQKKIEKLLQDKFPTEYKSRYSMVSFSLVPYKLAYEAGSVQSRILDDITAEFYPSTEINFEKAQGMIRSHLKPVMDKIDSAMSASMKG